MIRKLLFVPLCLLAVAAVDNCPQQPPPATKSMPANTSGGQLHITQASSQGLKYNPAYVLEVTDFDLDTPIKSFAQYDGPAIGSQALCEEHSVNHTNWRFDQDKGCWVSGPVSSKKGVWKPDKHSCDLSYEENIPTKKADSTPTHFTKIRVEVTAYHNVLVNGEIAHMRRTVKAGVISF